jgi:16S rRNA (cytidine1402-2'-O)-methyltransferase
LSDRPHSQLVFVPTPVGNLNDITLRSLEVLKEVDLILAEDTRVTAKLLKHYSISTPCSSFHQNNEHYKTESILEKISEGLRLAVCTDAGTPGISDPGFFLARAAIEAGIEIETLPGATAFVPALVNSGIPCDKFVFEGFLPHKKGRQTRLEKLATEERTMVFYESPYRVGKTLGQFVEYFGPDRLASVSREISKLFEEHQRGTLDYLLNHFKTKKAKGEFVIVVEGHAEIKK